MQRNVRPRTRRGLVNLEASAHRPVRAFQQDAEMFVVVPGVEIRFTLGRHAEQHRIEYRCLVKRVAGIGRVLHIYKRGDVAFR